MPAPGRRLSPVPRCAGLTLIELLVSLALALLVVGAVYLTYATAVRSVRSQQARRALVGPTADALDRLSRDLACAFLDGAGTDCVFRLRAGTESAAGTNAELTFSTLELPEGEADARWAVARQVTYRVLPAAGPAAPVLVREQRPLAGPGSDQPPQTNVLAQDVALFGVTIFDGEAWQPQWPAGAGAARPRAARVELRTGTTEHAAVLRTEVLIPAGLTITSRVLRATEF